jgi:UrcA family protein
MMKFLLGAALAASANAPAWAQDRPVAVSHADLTLSRAADVARLDHRIARAARAVCGSPSDADTRARNQAARCRRDTVASVAAARERAIVDATGPTLAAAR